MKYIRAKFVGRKPFLKVQKIMDVMKGLLLKRFIISELICKVSRQEERQKNGLY